MIYAIGMKGWVELRQCREAPKARVTKASKVLPPILKNVRIPDSPDNPYYYHYESKKVVEELKIVSTVWVGGRVLEAINSREFAVGAGLYVRPGKCQRVPRENMRLWRRSRRDVEEGENVREETEGEDDP